MDKGWSWVILAGMRFCGVFFYNQYFHDTWRLQEWVGWIRWRVDFNSVSWCVHTRLARGVKHWLIDWFLCKNPKWPYIMSKWREGGGTVGVRRWRAERTCTFSHTRSDQRFIEDFIGFELFVNVSPSVQWKRPQLPVSFFRSRSVALFGGWLVGWIAYSAHTLNRVNWQIMMGGV